MNDYFCVVLDYLSKKVNLAIFVGGNRDAFENILPALTVMGRKILYTGELGTASVLKVITNYLQALHYNIVRNSPLLKINLSCLIIGHLLLIKKF